MKGEFKVGQRVYVVIVGNRKSIDASWQEITKIGRKWANYGHDYRKGRFDIHTGDVDGGGFSSPGTVYLSEEEYQENVRRNAAWKILRVLPYECPDHLSVEDIEVMANKIGLAVREGAADVL